MMSVQEYVLASWARIAVRAVKPKTELIFRSYFRGGLFAAGFWYQVVCSPRRPLSADGMARFPRRSVQASPGFLALPGE